MKTNIVLSSTDRELFGVTIRQNTKEQFLSVTDLQKAYLLATDEYGWSPIRVHEFFSTKKAKLIMYQLLLNEGYVNYSQVDFIDKCSDLGLMKILKRLKVWETTGRSINKEIWCIPTIWKLIYINSFNDYSQINCPVWIKDINISIQKYSVKRSESQEKNFIDLLVQKTALFNKDIKRQYKISNFYYDLKITIIQKTFLIEYHEEQHTTPKQLDIDKLKFDLAVSSGFAFLTIPFNKEQEQLEYLREIFEEKYDISIINELESFRFYSLIDPKYAKLINEKVFGLHQTGMRNLASAKELRKIADVEKFVIQAIAMGFVNSEESVVSAIQNFN